jgi:hypothetical protein
MRKKDAVLISFFCGLLTMIVFTTAIVMFLPMSNNEFFPRHDSLHDLFATFYTFRFLLMLLFTLFSTSIVIGILKRYKVNYLFIFELDPHYKIT